MPFRLWDQIRDWIFVALLLIILFANAPATAQLRFPGTSLTFHTDLYAALDEAIAEYEGDILILFYDEAKRADKIVRKVLNEKQMRAFLDDNFALAAIKIGSNDWARLQQKYRPGAAANWPYILVDIRRFLSHGEFHGWESGSLGALETLKAMKEQGAVQGDIREWGPVN